MNIKKAFALTAATVSLATVAVGLSSCQFLPTDHTLTKVAEIAPTCTTEGVGEHYICSGCDLIFDDAEGKYKINAPKVLPTKHNLSFVAESNTPCKDGNIAHYACNDCGAIFADENGKTSLDSALLPAKHNAEIIAGKKGNCTEDGYSAYRVCKDCGETITPPKIVYADHAVTPSAELWGLSMEVIDGRAYLVIYGGGVTDRTCPDCGELAPLKIAADLQHNNNIDGMGWASAMVYANKNNFSSEVTEETIVKPSVEANVYNGLFEAYFDITDLKVGSTLTLHAGLDGAMTDLKNQGSGDSVEVFAEGKKFSFRLDSNTWKIASVVVTEATENEFNLNGRVNLKEIDGKPYIVYQGSWNTKNGSKAAVEAAITNGLATTFDIMELNTWSKPEFDYILNVKDDGAITLALCLEKLSPSENIYYMHRALGNTNSGGDVKLPTGHGYTLTVGNIRYFIKKGSSAASWLSNFTIIQVSEVSQ